ARADVAVLSVRREDRHARSVRQGDASCLAKRLGVDHGHVVLAAHRGPGPRTQTCRPSGVKNASCGERPTKVTCFTALVAVSTNVTELEPIETTIRVRRSGENPRPCTSSGPRESGEGFARCGPPSRIPPRSLFAAGSITETVFENCSAA